MKAPTVSHMSTPLRRVRARGFTLIELLIATTILLIILVVLLQVTGKIAEIWKTSVGKISAFQSARAGFTALTRTLARATTNTYIDYADASGNYRTSSSFVPTQFLRASELHFLSGPVVGLIPSAKAITNPGHAIFFQAPLGETSSTGGYPTLKKSLNSVGFYIQYDSLATSAILPVWLQNIFGTSYRFRLVQVVQPTENLNIYKYTNMDPITGFPTYTGMIAWLNTFSIPATSPRPRVIAEDVVLLVLRPRVAPKDEESLPGYDSTKIGSTLCPLYKYDSRAWQNGYGGQISKDPLANPALIKIMRNQAPPIVDVAMVCVDRRTLARLNMTSSTPPKELQLPALSGAFTGFTDSSKLDQDLTVYGKQLSDAHIRYRIFRTSTDIEGAKWSSN